MRAQSAVLASLMAAALPVAAQAQAHWSVYRYPDLGLSFEAPKPPVITDATSESGHGPTRKIDFAVDLGDHALEVTVQDLRRMTSGDADVDAMADGVVKGLGGTVISRASDNVGGQTGRDVVFQTQGVTASLRVVYSEHVAYEVLSFSTGSAVSPDGARFGQSFSLTPQHWLLYALPETQPAGDLGKVPFSRWMRASATTFTSIETCQAEANHNPGLWSGKAYEVVRYQGAVCFNPDTRHVRSVSQIPQTWTIPPIDVAGVVADPFMR